MDVIESNGACKIRSFCEGYFKEIRGSAFVHALDFFGGTKEHPLVMRPQPLFGMHTTAIGVLRSLRPRSAPAPARQDKSSGGLCLFCEPEEHVAYPQLTGSDGLHRVAGANLYPFSFLHLVLFSREHRNTLEALTAEDMKEFIDDAHLLMEIVKEAGETGEVSTEVFRRFVEGDEGIVARNVAGLKGMVNGMAFGMNFGKDAGASQDHAHMQVFGLPRDALLPADSEIAMLKDRSCLRPEDQDLRSGRTPEAYIRDYIKAIKCYKRNPADLGIERDLGLALLEKDDDALGLVVKDYGSVLLHAPFAPVVTHQLSVTCKERVTNLLFADEMTRKELCHALIDGIHGLASLEVGGALAGAGVKKPAVVDAGIRNLNITFKQTRVDDTSSSYRLTAEILPRRSTFALAELIGFYVCEKFPEYTAYRASLALEKEKSKWHSKK